MAATLKLTIRVDHTNGLLKLPFNSGTIDIGQAGKISRQAVQIIGTSEEAIVTTDITTLGQFVFQNLDASNFVEIGPDSGGTIVPLIQLLPGEACTYRAKPGTTMKAKADTSAINLLVIAYEK